MGAKSAVRSVVHQQWAVHLVVHLHWAVHLVVHLHRDVHLVVHLHRVEHLVVHLHWAVHLVVHQLGCLAAKREQRVQVWLEWMSSSVRACFGEPTYGPTLFKAQLNE